MDIDKLKGILLAGLEQQFDYVGGVIDEEDGGKIPDRYILDTSDFDMRKFAEFVAARLAA